MSREKRAAAGFVLGSLIVGGGLSVASGFALFSGLPGILAGLITGYLFWRNG